MTESRGTEPDYCTWTVCNCTAALRASVVFPLHGCRASSAQISIKYLELSTHRRLKVRWKTKHRRQNNGLPQGKSDGEREFKGFICTALSRPPVKLRGVVGLKAGMRSGRTQNTARHIAIPPLFPLPSPSSLSEL